MKYFSIAILFFGVLFLYSVRSQHETEREIRQQTSDYAWRQYNRFSDSLKNNYSDTGWRKFYMQVVKHYADLIATGEYKTLNITVGEGLEENGWQRQNYLSDTTGIYLTDTTKKK